MVSKNRRIRLGLVSNWMHVEIFTVDQASALWCGFDPTALDDLLFRKPPEFAATKQMIVSAILSGEISHDSTNNNLFRIGNYSSSYVNRTGLETLARKRNLFPAFLFDTLAPFGASEEVNTVKKGHYFEPVAATAPETFESQRSSVNKGGRPPQYDWDSFTMEIIYRANHPDGLPPTQAELMRDMLAWFQERCGAEPAESSVKSRISKIYNYLDLAKNRQA